MSGLRQYAEEILEAVPGEVITDIDKKFSLEELKSIAKMDGVSAAGGKKDIIRRLIALRFMEKSKEEVFRRFDEYKKRLREEK